jgi:hypothetical protein
MRLQPCRPRAGVDQGFRVRLRPSRNQSRMACPELVERGRLNFRPVQIRFFQLANEDITDLKRREDCRRRARHTCLTAFGSDGAFCANCCLGATTKKLNEKASLYEGHGFSRAVNSPCLTASDGMRRLASSEARLSIRTQSAKGDQP